MAIKWYFNLFEKAKKPCSWRKLVWTKYNRLWPSQRGGHSGFNCIPTIHHHAANWNSSS